MWPKAQPICKIYIAWSRMSMSLNSLEEVHGLFFTALFKSWLSQFRKRCFIKMFSFGNNQLILTKASPFSIYPTTEMWQKAQPICKIYIAASCLSPADKPLIMNQILLFKGTQYGTNLLHILFRLWHNDHTHMCARERGKIMAEVIF